MLDLKLLKQNFNAVQENLLKRGYEIPLALKDVLQKYNQVSQEIEMIRTTLNKKNKQYHNPTPEEKTLQLKLIQLQKEQEALQETRIEFLLLLPNLLHPTVPQGSTHLENPVLEFLGNTTLALNKQKLPHYEIAKNFNFNPELGVMLGKSRFLVLPPLLAKLQRTLLEKALNFYQDLGYQEHYVPYLVNKNTIIGTGQIPKFTEEVFTTQENLYLIPTGEVPLTNLLREQTLPAEFKKLKLMTRTPCFRKEVGASGKDTKGFLRQHQFEKVELVHLCHPDLGYENFEELYKNVKQFMLFLGVPFRVVELCTGDIGFAGHKAYDIEMWFQGEGAYREVATLTWCHDFQARRMKTKLKDKRYIHTLNGTGLAVGRVLAAILEYFWDGDRLCLPAHLL